MKLGWRKTKKNFWQTVSPMKFILGGYCLIILLGTALLSLPAAARGSVATPVTDSFFTAASATCVTGLIRYDTYCHWTLFGQLVILAMIQVGGIGFMTVALLIMMLARRKIGLGQRSLMQNSISAPQIGGIVRMTRFIARGTFLIEGVGAAFLAFDFVPRFGPAKGLYFSIFHSVSAFCNGGFDLMGGTTGEFSSLTGMRDNLYVNCVIMLLIFLGGLGFFVWSDVLHKQGQFSRLTLQSKMVLSISVFLVVFGALAMFWTEYAGNQAAGVSLPQQVLHSLFASVSARTAGFNTIDLTSMTEPGIFVMICLMLVGGSTGSTAGGIKTTTLWVLCVSVYATFSRKKNIEAFGRRMEEGITRTASCVFMTYLLLILAATTVISVLEGLPVLTVLFETTSAMATVGLTLGITPSLGMVSKLILAFLMLCGRVGSITMLLAFSSEKKVIPSRLPLEKIQVG